MCQKTYVWLMMTINKKMMMNPIKMVGFLWFLFNLSDF